MVFLVAFVLLTGEALLTQRSLEDKTLRLHVVANSDGAEDQAQKLRVRDHVLKTVSDLTSNCNTLEETEVVIGSHLEDIQCSAQELLREEGSAYSVKVTLCQEEFMTRDYDGFSLPAGTYHSLRVVIGSGQGKNWWCVVFPSLCAASSVEEFEASARQGGYEENEISLIRKKESRFYVQFKMVEILRGLFR